jgi:RNA polymerase sigma factor (sigma-70 family)
MKKRSPKALFDLIKNCRSGDEDSWHELVDMIAPVIFAIGRKSKLSRDECFDIYGQICLDLVENIGTLKSPEKILAFVATMTRRKIYNFYENMHLKDYMQARDAGIIPDRDEDTPEKTYENIQKREVLMEAMLSLPTRDFKLVEALFFDPKEPSYKEIAGRLNFPISSIGPTRARALAKLYKVLKRKRYVF